MIKDIISTIEEIAAKDPDRICYDYLGTTNTYADLKRESDRFAQTITASGIGAKEPVMIWGGQSFTMLASFLGCVKSGHAYIPIASYSNKERLQMIQEVSQAKLLLAIDPLPEIDLTGLKVLTCADLVDGDAELTPVQGDDNFYIIFTSGTTGKPKGVQISHNNLLSFVNWEIGDFDLPDHPSFLAQAPYSFDLSVMSIYPALVSAGKLVVLPHDVAENLGQLFGQLPNMNFNVWVSTPSFAQMCLLDQTFNQSGHPDLTHFLFCGEELTHSLADRLLKLFPQARLFNTYGPTEATVAMTSLQITPELLAKYDRLPIGRVKPDTKVTIDQNNANDEGAGEIIISGPSVSKGYLNNPEKTEASFNGQSYKSGDAGFFDGDLLFYRGRLDFQIKFNGYRIELEEINFYLSQSQYVRYAVVAPKYDKDHKVKQLIAEIELTNQAREQYTDQELIKLLRADLAENVMPYMLPQRFVFKDSLPISQNGKVDIKAVIKEVNQA